ncbi:MAG: SGNH/GDSL hydrolase family protein [Armatimonadota bacterium]
MTKRDCYTEEFRKMVVIGPSITAGGWSTSPEMCWASVLAQTINDFQSSPVELINKGIGANVISTRSAAYQYASKPAGNERVERDIIEHKPDLVIIGEFAVNDARGGTPPEVFEEELVAIIRRIRESVDPLIVLSGPTYIMDYELGGETWSHADPSIFNRFNKLVGEVAARENCFYVNVLNAMDETDWMVHYDGVHVNDLGHRIIANEIFKVLAQNCSCLARHTKEFEQTSPRWRDESSLMED